jgi:hypothetical protein
MWRKITTFIALVPALAALSCGGTTDTAALVAEEDVPAFRRLPFVADSAQIREMAAVFRTTEPRFWRDTLSAALNPDIFWACLEEFRQSRPERWDTLMSRLAYCREQQLGTPIDAEQPDIRWSLFLQYGPPAAEWITPGEYAGNIGEMCTTWVFTWTPTVADTMEKAAGCIAEPGHGYPVHLLAGSDEVALSRGRIYPYVEFWVLPNWGQETHNLWVGTWIPGNQFSRPTLDEGLLQLELRVYERDGKHQKTMVAQKYLSTDLQMLRAAVHVAAQRRFLRAMGYLECELQPGDYRVVLTVQGARHNDGRVEHDITIPRDPRLSDLLLIRQINAQGVNPGISRNGVSLYAVPEKELPQGITVRTRLEFILPPEYDGRYHVCASLHPLARHQLQRTTDVATGPILYIQDENGNPMYGIAAPDDMAPDSRQGKKGIILLDEGYHTTDSVVVFELPLELTMKPGDYFLRIEIGDTNKKRTLGSRSTLIRITARSNVHFNPE